jgi:hypothetical protein
MIDSEVARLRRLRNLALQVRSIATVLASSRWGSNDALLEEAACSTWRLARTVRGRLKSHPHEPYQQDVGIATLVRQRLVAQVLAWTARSRRGALVGLEAHLKLLSRALDDARALTWSSDLSDAFGRSQGEIKSLAAALAHDIRGEALRSPHRVVAAAVSAGDWPYLAF